MLSGLDVAIPLYADFPQARGHFFLNLLFAALILGVRHIHQNTGARGFTVFRDWYCLGILIAIYLESNKLVPLIHPHDVDHMIILLDRLIFFGYDPTVLLERFLWPPATEVLQLVYASFYFLPFSYALVLYLKGDRMAFHVNAAVIVIGFYVSFAGYYVLPAIGPRFTLAHLQQVPLTGLWSFPYVRATLDALGGITRDCCPSGHTLISVLTVLLAYRYRRPYLGVVAVWTALLLLSTVYLRYHYVSDILVGLLLAVAIFRYALPRAERFVYANGVAAPSAGREAVGSDSY